MNNKKKRRQVSLEMESIFITRLGGIICVRERGEGEGHMLNSIIAVNYGP